MIRFETLFVLQTDDTTMTEFTCRIRREGPDRNITVLDLRGGIFISNLATFKEVLDGVEQRRIDRLVMNCSELNFISSPAIGAILEINGKIGRRGGTMILVGVTPEISNVLELISFHKLVDIMSDEQQALDRLTRPDTGA